MSARQKLFNKITQNLAPGKVEWIGVRPARRADMMSYHSIQALAGRGLEGDRSANKSSGSARQVTFISLEHIKAMADILGKNTIDPGLLRRNIVISGININALRYQVFSINGVLFEATAQCHPCSRMDENLGPGGHAAMLGHGGLCAKILSDGEIHVGDQVIKLDEPPSATPQMSLSLTPGSS